ncbi:hypothetical protein [Phytoactinopolyspora halotolerans]|uniref:Cupin domain-containing protein n=1 Tax=Phytoactinopolyspora halotolerans TaxID=1981512 RepID=A0A6L9S8U0_9ACTN|nr:hypothetical protein [Phytoactinopolyspora halotolerans]NEE00948.1 hypothetical protein [Phytoactinopolyspora halotolerans]
MSENGPRIRLLGSVESGPWERLRDTRFYLQDVVDDARDGLLSVGFLRGDDGATIADAFPYDLVIVPIAGALTFDIDDETVTARTGDLVYGPAGAHMQGRAVGRTEAAYVCFPPAWRTTHQATGAGPSAGEASATRPSGSALVRRFDDQPLERVADIDYFSTAVVDDPEFELSVRFEQVGRDVAGDHFFPYDEVHIVRDGTLAIDTDDETIRVRAGEVVHLPLRARARVRAEEEVSMVSVTYPPLWHIKVAAQ